MKTKLFAVFLYCVIFLSYLSRPIAYGQNATAESCAGSSGGCDTIAIVTKPSPWRLGLYAGPSFAYCGSWENTFNTTNYRDKSLYNGAGIEVDLNADYFFIKKKPDARVKFGLGAVLGYHKFFFRKDLDDYLGLRILSAGLSENQALVRKNGSEDFYLVAGPVLNWAFTRKVRSPFIEASARGGVFRTTPAAILVTGKTTNENIYTVTATDKRYHPGLFASFGIFFPLKNRWAIGLEATGFRTRVNYDFPADKVWSFERKHGGFSAGVALRKNFVRDIPVKKDPSGALACASPELDVLINGVSASGKYFKVDEVQKCDSIKVTWRSRSSLPQNETFTARIHQIANGQDKIIDQVICQPQNTMLWPVNALNEKGCPTPGQYYVTVQSHQTTPCATCISDVSTSGFSFVESETITKLQRECLKQCVVQFYAYKRVKTKRVKYGKSPSSCEGCICPIDTVSSYRSVYYPLESYTLENCENPNLNQEVQKVKIPSWARTVYANVETIQIGEICPNAGRKKQNFKASVKKGKASSFTVEK